MLHWNVSSNKLNDTLSKFVRALAISQNTEKFSDFLKNNSDQKIMANLKTRNILKKESINSNKICLIIGPEGGFSEDEIQLAKDNKITEISFGKNRLRSETAAIYGLSILRSITS